MAYGEFMYMGANAPHELYIEYDYSPFVPGRMYMSNGDPGYPDEGGDFDITSIKMNGREIINLLSSDTIRDIENAFMESCN